MHHPDKISMHAPEARIRLSEAAATGGSKMLFFSFIFILQPVAWLQSRHCLVRDVFD